MTILPLSCIGETTQVYVIYIPFSRPRFQALGPTSSICRPFLTIASHDRGGIVRYLTLSRTVQASAVKQFLFPIQAIETLTLFPILSLVLPVSSTCPDLGRPPRSTNAGMDPSSHPLSLILDPPESSQGPEFLFLSSLTGDAVPFNRMI